MLLTLLSAASGVAVRSYVASGGMALSGAAAASKGKSFAASGGQIFGGVATTSYTAGAATQTWTYSGTGGLQQQGSGDTQYQPGLQTFSYIGSGGLSAAGQAITQRIAANDISVGGGIFRPRQQVEPEPKRFSYIGAGSAHVSGAADIEFAPVPLRIFEFKPTGGAAIGGVAEIDYHDQIAAVIAADDEWLLLAA